MVELNGVYSVATVLGARTTPKGAGAVAENHQLSDRQRPGVVQAVVWCVAPLPPPFLTPIVPATPSHTTTTPDTPDNGADASSRTPLRTRTLAADSQHGTFLSNGYDRRSNGSEVGY